MRKNYLLFFSLIFIISSFSTAKEAFAPATYISKQINLSSPSAFYHSILPALNRCDSAPQRQVLADSIFYLAKSRQWIPIVFADTAVFLYKHSTDVPATVQVFGDLNGWSDIKSPQITLSNYKDTKLYYSVYKAPETTTRVDYVLVVNGSWILDPSNPKLMQGGYGLNSELTLSDYKPSEWVNIRSKGNKGTLSNNIKIYSDTLEYDLDYRVYLPYGYKVSEKYPVIFTTDGQEYNNLKLGAATTIADNLIQDGKIKPIIIVFVDARDPVTKLTRCKQEYVNNRKYVHFLSTELYKQIKNNYSIIGKPNQTAILGNSLGGINSAYTGILSPDIFGLIAIQSPAFWYYPNIMNMYAKSKKASLKIYMDTGTIYDTQDKAQEMKTILDKKGYQLQYSEYSEGHTWGNWRSHIDDILIYFFQK